MVISVFSCHYEILFNAFFFTLCWLPLQLSPKGDNNLPTEAETEEKEMDTSKEDDLPSEKNSKEVCESFFYVPENTLILCQLMWICYWVLKSYSYYYYDSLRSCLII